MGIPPMAVTMSLSALPVLKLRRQSNNKCSELGTQLKKSSYFFLVSQNRNQFHIRRQKRNQLRRLVVLAVTKGSSKSNKSDESIPSWAKPDSDEAPPWARDEGNKSTSQPTFEIPFFAYLLASAIIAIAAIGSIFEYVNQRPVFGILQSDSIFYAPILGFFAFTGIPTSAYLWFKSVQVANKEAEEQDRRDGYF